MHSEAAVVQICVGGVHDDVSVTCAHPQNSVEEGESGDVDRSHFIGVLIQRRFPEFLIGSHIFKVRDCSSASVTSKKTIPVAVIVRDIEEQSTFSSRPQLHEGCLCCH